jgi:cyclic pyranopterin phosphate synthase
MIDVTDKAETERQAVAKGKVKMKPTTLELIRRGEIEKGDVLAGAQTAGIMAAKETPRLIPLCHPLLLTNVTVEFHLPENADFIDITASAKGVGKTGFEMEALVAVAVAALTIYDMCKGVDRGMTIEEIHLVRKSGGKSGTYIATEHKGGRERGKIVAVCLSQRKGTKKPVNQGLLEADYGFVGDMHAGSTRQVSLLAMETVNKMLSALESINPDRMRSQNIKIRPGDSAENLLTEGIDLMSLHIGTRIYIGKEAILEVSQIGKAFHRPGFYLLPLEGVFARVVRGGVVKPGDDLTAQLNGI